MKHINSFLKPGPIKRPVCIPVGNGYFEYIRFAAPGFGGSMLPAQSSNFQSNQDLPLHSNREHTQIVVRCPDPCRHLCQFWYSRVKDEVHRTAIPSSMVKNSGNEM